MLAILDGERRPLVTWIDVERRIAVCTSGLSEFPDGIKSIRVYSDSIDVFVCEGGEQKALNAFLAMFSEAEVEREDGVPSVLLRVGGARLHVEVVREGMTGGKVKALLPLWKRLAYAKKSKLPVPTMDAFDASTRMYAFHSFKGGVGRTTSMLAFAAARISLMDNLRDGRVLIIDADTEAPGITYWLPPSMRSEVSYISFIEAIHASSAELDDVVSYFAAEIVKNTHEIEGVEVCVLPAFISQADLLDARALPENVVKGPDGAWRLGAAINKLALAINARDVFVDLRAGLSELSSPILFDPRFQRVVVTTLAEQSISGVELTLSCMKTVWDASGQLERSRHPLVVFSMLTESIKNGPAHSDALERLERVYTLDVPVGDSQKDASILDSKLATIDADFSPDLMILKDIRSAFDVLRKTSLFDHASSWLSKSYDSPVAAVIGENELNEQALRLAEVCRVQEFAENQGESGLLVTEALRNLGRSFSSEVPNAVLIGAKGSGKTFSYLQITRAKSWSNFLASVGVESGSAGTICVMPVLRSNELGNANSEFVSGQVERVSALFGCAGGSLELSVIRDDIERQLAVGGGLSDWIGFWVRMMSASVGLRSESFSELNSYVASKGHSIVFLFDGIEDVLREVLDDSNQRLAVESIIELPNRIRELRSPSIGVLAFVREDYAKVVKTQNFGQFQSRYEKFRLDWSPREFLQLILWLCKEAGVEWAKSAEIDAFNIDRLVESLEKLWGRKLAKNDAAEAYSARWVYAALSDLRGRLQARDVVRFLRFAAEQAPSKRLQWFDRIVPPAAVRGALLPTSVSKVEEAIQEYEPLKVWKAILGDKGASVKKIPFAPEDLGLDGKLRQALQEIGVIFEDVERPDAERLYVPEIYRHGLGLSSSAGARPRVQALLQRALGSLPF